jgi:Poly(ADP-ribose) polymerase catalytic domain
MDDQVDESVNEYYLFHGTTEAIVEAIEKQGFEDRLSSPGLFGRGMYFAESSTKADQYAGE